MQTLFRLNRTYPGKDWTAILKFVNGPEPVLGQKQLQAKPSPVMQRFAEVTSRMVYEIANEGGCGAIYHEPLQLDEATAR